MGTRKKKNRKKKNRRLKLFTNDVMSGTKKILPKATEYEESTIPDGYKQISVDGNHPKWIKFFSGLIKKLIHNGRFY